MREEYEAWFIGKFGFPPMPIHSRVLDFCWAGYQAGRKNIESEIDRLKGMVDEIHAARKVNSQHDKLLVELESLRQQLTAATDQIAAAVAACKVKGDALQLLWDESNLEPDGYVVEALAVTPSISEWKTRWQKENDELRQQVTLLRDAATRAHRKLSAYVGVCTGDKELTDTIIPMLKEALSSTESKEQGT